jgi:hypothetical protein
VRLLQPHTRLAHRAARGQALGLHARAGGHHAAAGGGGRARVGRAGRGSGGPGLAPRLHPAGAALGSGDGGCRRRRRAPCSGTTSPALPPAAGGCGATHRSSSLARRGRWSSVSGWQRKLPAAVLLQRMTRESPTAAIQTWLPCW